MESEQSRKQSLSKVDTIQQLRNTITQLEGIIQELDSITVQQLPESPSLEILMHTTEALEEAIASAKQSSASPPTETIAPEDTEVEVKSETIVSEVEHLSQETIITSSTTENAEAITATPEIISEQPETSETNPISQDASEQSTAGTEIPESGSKNQKWLTFAFIMVGILIASVALQLLPSNFLEVSAVTPREIILEETTILSQQETVTEPEIAELPETVHQNIIAEIEEKPTEKVTEVIPEATVTIKETTEKPPEVIPEATVTIKETTEKPPEVVPEATVIIQEVVPQETKPLQLTPEQNLIAAIAEKVNKITTSYEPDLLDLIEADLNSNQVVITMNNQWYELKSDYQDKVANEILKRSRQLAFGKVRMQNPEGELIARSPVVGNNMVILKRNNES